MEDFELPREDKDYFDALKEKYKEIDLNFAINNWLEEFSMIILYIWDYVQENNMQNQWVKDKPGMYERVVSALKQAMDLINMCHLSNGGYEGFVNKNIIKILQAISENEAFPLYPSILDDEELLQNEIGGIIKELFDGALHLNYIEELANL